MGETPDTPLGVLLAAIARSGLAPKEFAEQVVSRDERTVRRWRKGTVQIPAVVVRRLLRYLEEPRQ
jgi:hypothetical protein